MRMQFFLITHVDAGNAPGMALFADDRSSGSALGWLFQFRSFWDRPRYNRASPPVATGNAAFGALAAPPRTSDLCQGRVRFRTQWLCYHRIADALQPPCESP